MSNENCKELLNIKYKNMLLNPNKNIFSKKEHSHTLDDFLDSKQPTVIKMKTWSQLNKMEKLNKLYQYVDSISPEYNFTEKDRNELKQYLKKCLNRKQLQRIKDIQYDKKDGNIKKINGLHIKNKCVSGSKERRFTLKNVDKKDSTLKNLGSGKMNRSKMISNNRVSRKTRDDKSEKESEINE